MRDSAVDLVKAACLLVVVGLHAIMAGVTVDAEGLVVTNALEGNYWFAWSTWAVQVMPLFFLLGGFASIQQWRRMREKGAVPADYIRQRVNRLAKPALLPIALVGATLATLALTTGISPEVLGQVGFRIGQPLWFLLCSAFVPLMTTLHERAPRLTLVGLIGTAAIVDTVSVTFTLPGVNILNFVFVWLAIQQLGFWYADGFFARLPRWSLLAAGVGAFGLLVVLTLGVGYSTDMYVNLNPPTVCILVLGVGQMFLVAFAHPWLERLAALSPVKRSADAINRNSMTIYLWHVPVVVIIALTMLGAALPMPEPLSRDWWQTRPLFLALVAVGMIPVVLLIARLERRSLAFVPTRMPAILAAAKVVLSVAGVATILVVGFTPVWSWAIGLGLLAVAVLIGPPKVRALRPRSRQAFD